jgi:hypothetical protein
MKTFAYLIITSFISTFAYWGSLGAKNPFPLYGIVFGIWALFIWGCNSRMKKDANRRFRERIFEDYMRDRTRGPRGF